VACVIFEKSKTSEGWAPSHWKTYALFAALNTTNLLRDPVEPNHQKLRPTSVCDSISDKTCSPSLREAQNVTHVICGPSFLEIKTRLSSYNSELLDS